MPTYAYRCADCGHAFDVQQSFSDDALTVCPECQGTLRKVFSAVGVVFKGSGFYRTDSRGKSSGSSGSSSSTSTTTSSDAAKTASSTSTSGSSASTAPASSTASTTTSSGKAASA